MTELVYLNEIVSVKGGKRLPKGHDLVNEITKHKYIRARDIKDGKINFDQPVYILNQTHEKIKNYVVNTGDIILTIAGTIGEVGLVTEEFNQSNLTENAVKIRVDSSKVSNVYLKYYLSSKAVYDYFQLLASGAAQPKLGIYKILSTKINLPPLKTQKKIASILSGYDDLIENNLKRIKILEEMAQQTYEEWFVRMRFPGHDASRASASLNPATGLPEGWEKVKLKDCCDLVMGQSPKSEFYNDEKLGLPFHQGVKDYGFRFPINTSWSTVGNKKAKPNSILFSVRAPVGRLNVASEEIILGRGLAAINHKKGLNSFVFYQLRKIFFEDNLIGGGAIFASVTKSDVERIEFIYNEELANKFNDFASKIDQQILNLTNQNQRLREARDILLPRLMMGMVEV